jgi:hypothetical protein
MFCIYLEESAPKAVQAHADRIAANPDLAEAACALEIVRRDVGARWKSFSAQDISALKGRDDLVREVASRYGIEKSQAGRDVDLVLKGRRI